MYTEVAFICDITGGTINWRFRREFVDVLYSTRTPSISTEARVLISLWRNHFPPCRFSVAFLSRHLK